MIHAQLKIFDSILHFTQIKFFWQYVLTQEFVPVINHVLFQPDCAVFREVNMQYPLIRDVVVPSEIKLHNFFILASFLGLIRGFFFLYLQDIFLYWQGYYILTVNQFYIHRRTYNSLNSTHHNQCHRKQDSNRDNAKPMCCLEGSLLYSHEEKPSTI